MIDDAVGELIERGVVSSNDVFEVRDTDEVCINVAPTIIAVCASRSSRQYFVWLGELYSDLEPEEFRKLVEVCRTLEKHGYRYRGLGKSLFL